MANKDGYYVHPRCNNILCSFHSHPPDACNPIPNTSHDFLILQMSDAMDEATFLAAAQPLDEIIGYIGDVSLYRCAKKQELIDVLDLHMVYTRKKTAFSQDAHDIMFTFFYIS